MKIIKQSAVPVFILMILLISAAAGGCSPEEQAPGWIDIVAGGETDFTIIRPDITSETVIGHATRLRKTVNEKTGVSVPIETDWLPGDSPPDPQAREILVGLTNRPESGEVFNKLEGVSFAVEAIGNKIVIAASNDEILEDAVDYFIETYLAEDGLDGVDNEISRIGAGYFAIPANTAYLSEPIEAFYIVKDAKSEYIIIRAENAPQNIIDLAVSAARAIETATGVRPSIKSDWLMPGETSDPNAKEILIGITNRRQTAQVLDEINIDQYAVKQLGAKIVVAGRTNGATGEAVDEFIRMVSKSAEPKVNGKSDLSFIKLNSIGGSSDWILGIPEYSGGFPGVYDSHNSSYQLYYSETDSAEFAAYKDKLAEAGYDKIFESEAAGNLFATFSKENTLIHAYYIGYKKAVRVTVGPVVDGTKTLLPPENKEYTKICASQLTSFRPYAVLAENGGHGWLIRLEDGSFIVIDGGSRDTRDAKQLYELMTEQNVRGGKPVIAAWYLSHPHNDHYGVFVDFAPAYGDLVELEMFICNAPSRGETPVSVYQNPDYFMDTQYPNLSAKFGSNVRLYIPQTGQRFSVRNASFEVLYTQNDLYPTVPKWFNDTGIVTRMTIGAQSMIWLGDLMTVGSDILSAMYGDYLKSDIVQISHHGLSNSGTARLYQHINPAVALWGIRGADLTPLKGIAANAALLANPGLKENIVSSDGTRTLVLPYNP